MLMGYEGRSYLIIMDTDDRKISKLYRRMMTSDEIKASILYKRLDEPVKVKLRDKFKQNGSKQAMSVLYRLDESSVRMDFIN